MQLWAEIRRRVLAGEISMRQACAQYQLNWRTVKKIVSHTQPAPRRASTRVKPTLDPVIAIIHGILEEDRHAPPKQRHTAVRIHQRLTDEHNYTGCITGVRTIVRLWKKNQAEVFIPLTHPPGEAQVDFGHALVEVAGQRTKAALFVLTLPHSGAIFACLFPRECTEAFHQGHVLAFNFFTGVPTRISYDNTRIAVAKLIGTHLRQLTHEFQRLQSHFLFESHFCGVRRANEKGHVEGGVGYVRRNFLVPVPCGPTWQAINECLAANCRRDQQRRMTRQTQPKSDRLTADQAAFRPLPIEPFEARRIAVATINSLALGRFDGNDYSVPSAYAYQTLTAIGTTDVVRFTYRNQVVAEHRRCWRKKQTIFDPLHYLAVLERKPGALDHAAPLANWKLPDCFAALRKRLESIDPSGGTRQFIRVLRLLETHELMAVTAAVEESLSLSIHDADAIRLLIERRTDTPAASFDLVGRPRLAGVRVPTIDLSAYRSLLSTNPEQRS